jgi:hypothetical protein
MKPILTVILILTLFSVKSQSSNTSYLAQPDLKRFTGEWQYVSNDTTFTLNLKLVKTYVKGAGGFYIDLIQGDYAIMKNGQIIQSSVKGEGINSGAYVDKDVSKDKIHFLFSDLSRKSKNGDVVFELFNSNADKANWKLNNTEGVRIGYYDSSFSVPVKAVFKKIK